MVFELVHRSLLRPSFFIFICFFYQRRYFLLLYWVSKNEFWSKKEGGFSPSSILTCGGNCKGWFFVVFWKFYVGLTNWHGRFVGTDGIWPSGFDWRHCVLRDFLSCWDLDWKDWMKGRKKWLTGELSLSSWMFVLLLFFLFDDLEKWVNSRFMGSSFIGPNSNWGC